MAPLAAEITVDVALEVVTVDDDRLRRLVLGRVLSRDRIRLLVDDEHESLRVWRPREAGDATLHLRHALRFTAPPIEQPDLGALALLTPRHEGEVAPVWAPPRSALALGA